MEGVKDVLLTGKSYGAMLERLSEQVQTDGHAAAVILALSKGPTLIGTLMPPFRGAKPYVTIFAHSRD